MLEGLKKICIRQNSKLDSPRYRGKQKVCSIYMCNVNGLVSKIDSLVDIINKLDPSIIVLCETKATNAFVNTQLKKLNYSVCAKPGSGLVIAVKKNYGSLINVSSCDNPGIISTKLKFRGISIRIIAVYGPP
jgi:exonuclease III